MCLGNIEIKLRKIMKIRTHLQKIMITQGFWKKTVKKYEKL